MLGKLLIALGLALLIGGIVGSRAAFPALDVNSIDVEPTAEELCQPGEKLETEQGASTYRPGQGYSRTTAYYCVDDAGRRREVTGEFVEGLFGQVTGLIPAFASGIGITLITGALTTIGAVLLVIGLILTFARRPRVPNPQGLSASLRRLDEALRTGLITQEEYDRMRQQLLDALNSRNARF